MFRLSEAVNLAIHALSYMAGHADQAISVTQVAGALDISADHLSKVLQRLSRGGLVRSRRGPKGGFVLALPASELPLIRIVEMLEGPWTVPHCLTGGNICGDACALHKLTTRVYGQIHAALSDTTLADLGKRRAARP